MNIKKAIFSGFLRWRDYKGRASRSDFWLFVGFMVITFIGASFLDSLLFGAEVDPETGAFTTMRLFTFLSIIIPFAPFFTLVVRRLHDLNLTGWWSCLILSSIIPGGEAYGFLILAVMCMLPGSIGDNPYGKDPVDRPAPPAPKPAQVKKKKRPAPQPKPQSETPPPPAPPRDQQD